MSFKVADAYVSVTADDTGLAADLKTKVAAAVATASGPEDAVPIKFRTDASALDAALGAALVEAKEATEPEAVDLGKHTGALTGDAFSRAVSDEVDKGFTDGSFFSSSALSGVTGMGHDTGSAFSATFSSAAKDNLTFASVFSGLGEGSPAMEQLKGDMEQGGEEAAQGLADGVEKKRTVTDKAAQDSGDGMSKLLIAGFVTAAAAGPAALLMGTAGALVGVEALISKSNANIATDYTRLATTAKAAVEQAVAPLTTDIEASVGILQQGVSALKPELTSLFAAVAPDAESIASGMVQFADRALPGIESGMKDIAPYMSDFADDVGKIGSGIGGFFSGLGTGAAGGASGLSALTSLIQQLLPDVGQIIGALSGGLGPALQDVDDAAGPTAKALATVVSAVPPGVIETAADAVTVLFAAFKIATWTKAIEEGTTFSQYLKGMGAASAEAAVEVTVLGDAEEAAAVKTGLMDAASALGSKALTGLGAAAGTALKIGLIVGAAAAVGEELGKLSGVGSSTGTVPQLTGMLLAAGDGADHTQQQLIDLADAMSIMGQVSQGQAAQGLATVDQALAQLYATDPKTATSEFNSMSAAMKANGATTAEIAADFPAYTAAVQDAKNAVTENGQAQLAATSYAQTFAAAVATQTTALQAQAFSFAVNTTAANSALPAQSQLSQAAVNAEIAYQGASTAATSYTAALNSLYGKYGDTSQAQAALTTGLAGLAGQITKGTNAVNLNSAAGAKNFTAFEQVSQAGQNYAEKLYEQTQNAGLANQALQTSATNLDAVAAKAGLTKAQIAQLNTELYGVPAVKDIKITDNAPTVSNQLLGLQQQLTQLSKGASMNISTNMGGAKAINHNAGGGPVRAGEMSWVGEEGPEIVTFGADGYVTPNNQIGRTVGGGSGGGMGGVTIQNLTISMPMTGIVDFTDPNSLTVAGRRMAINISNAILQVTNSRAGAFA